jgi:succinate dehydrogenase / fumarate reductase flavoprotein subunit
MATLLFRTQSAAKAAAQARIDALFAVKGGKTVDDIHRQLGNIMWEKVGMARNKAGLQTAVGEIQKLREEFWQNVRVSGDANNLNPELEKAGRLADFLELGELMATDALERNESCGGHFREEFQTPDNEAQRDDENFCHVSAWEYTGDSSLKGKKSWQLHKESLTFERIKLATRSYK